MSEKSERLKIRPLTLREANEVVGALHRHHKPVTGHRFSIGAVTEAGRPVGAAICGHPVARKVDQVYTLEVTRLVTDGTRNACSALYAAAARAAEAMGFKKIQTYILESEPGTSLLAAGWANEGPAGGGDGWKKRNGARAADQPIGRKTRWARYLNGGYGNPWE